MVKLVGVLGGGEEGGAASPRVCLARRQLPLTIEQDLTMIMALDDYCMACGVDPCGQGSRHLHDQDWGHFLRNYRSLGKDEATASLMVTPSEVVTTLAQLVTCVGCRRSVEALYQALTVSGDSALEPLVIASDGVVSVNREHIEVEDSLANLFCGQVLRLSRELLDGGEGKGRAGRRGGRGGRCAQHGLGTKKLVTMNNWQDTWDCMEKECREEVVLLPYSVLRQTLDSHLKKHRFCCECKIMVNKAYTMLVEEGQDCDCDHKLNSDGTVNMYNGISACSADLHVHVKCDHDFIEQLFWLAEPEFTGVNQERHAKTIQLAQKEVLTCIGVALFERFERIQQKLKEREQTCDLLFLTLIKTLRTSLDMAAEKKRGVGDLELLCQEIEREEKRKEGKKETKRNKKARRKESKIVALPAQINGLEGSGKLTSDTKGSKVGNDDHDELTDGVKHKVMNQSGPSVVSVGGLHQKEGIRPGCPCNLKHCIVDASSVTPVSGWSGVKICCRPLSSCRPICCRPLRGCVNHLCPVHSLEDMLEEEEGWVGGEIPQEDIKKFLDKREDIMIRRKKLRENLKKRFAQLCLNGLTPAVD